jgi:hypothetical protein
VLKTTLILLTSVLLIPLAGCSSGDVAPRFELVSARTLERSEDGQVVALTLRGENANDHEIELRVVRYRVSADGVEFFKGQRSAEVALPRYGRVDMELLAAFPNDMKFGSISTISLSGSVEYLHPGPLVETLYDNRLRRPTVGLRGSIPLEH